MINQVGLPQFDENGLIKRGVIIRHLILPGHIQNSKNILKWIKDNLGSDTYISLMAQYFPTYKANTDEFVKICFNSSANPCVIVPVEGDEFLYLILPVRIIG